MNDLTQIKGIGKATAKKLSEAGFDSFDKLAAATDAEALQKLQDAGFATVDIDAWVKAAADLVTAATTNNPSESSADGGASNPAGPATDGGDGGQKKAKAARRLVALQEIRHLGVTYEPGQTLPDTVEAEERDQLLKAGCAEERG